MDIRNFFKAAAAPTAKKKNAAAAAEAKVGKDAQARGGDLEQLEEKKKKRNEEQTLEDDAAMEVAPVAKKAKKVRNVLAVKRQREAEAVASEATTEPQPRCPKKLRPCLPRRSLSRRRRRRRRS